MLCARAAACRRLLRRPSCSRPPAEPAESESPCGWPPGWGVLYSDYAAPAPPSEPGLPYRVRLPLTAPATCSAIYTGGALPAASILCAGQNGASTCFGDSGGPLAALVAGGDGWRTAAVIGVTSFGGPVRTLNPKPFTLCAPTATPSPPRLRVCIWRLCGGG